MTQILCYFKIVEESRNLSNFIQCREKYNFFFLEIFGKIKHLENTCISLPH